LQRACGSTAPKPKLVRDVINGVCHQRYIKCLEHWKNDANVNVHVANENVEDKLSVLGKSVF